jgi:S1-C subfamily serine protease
LEEPIGLMSEPDDEAQREALAPGGFTGIHVGDARQSLDALVGGSEGLLVTRVVENSPGEAGDVAEGDVLLAAVVEGDERVLEWPSQWRELELHTPPGTVLVLAIDRAGREIEREVEVVPRLRPADRDEAVRLREEAKVGVVVRAGTEVEARAAGLGPGAGAVIVGLARSSPWRDAGLVYGDMIVAVGDEPLAHPQALLDAIRAAEPGDTLALEVVRGDQRFPVDAAVGRRERQLTDFHIPLIYRYRRDPDRRETSCLFGLYRYRRTEAAWDVRLLWFISFGGGDSERLERVE